MCKTAPMQIRTQAAEVYAAHREGYLAQLVAPLDDMWAAFADMAAPYALVMEDEVVGSCCVDAEGRLLRFFVLPRFQQHAEALLRLALREVGVRHMIVCTLDPGYLSVALDVASSVQTHSLLFSSVTEPNGPGLDDLRLAESGDHARVVDFKIAAIGAPREFLEGYVRTRIERQEHLLFEVDGEIQCVGELRRDVQQDGIAQLGLIVQREQRTQGIGTRMLSSLVTRSTGEGLAPICSTEVTNVGARRAIERAGFRATHRLLRIEFALQD